MFLGERKLDLVMLWPTEARWKKYGHARQSASKHYQPWQGHTVCAGGLTANSIFNRKILWNQKKPDFVADFDPEPLQYHFVNIII